MTRNEYNWIISGVTAIHKPNKFASNMGYTLNKPSSSNKNNKKMSALNDFDDDLKKLELEIEKRRKQQCYDQFGYQVSDNICGATVCKAPEYINAYDSQGRSCAIVSAAYMPNDRSNAIEYFKLENQQLRNAMQGAVAKNAQLVDEINRLRRENIELKTKKSKKKDFDIKVYDSLNKVGNGFSGLYQKFITWLNT